MVRLVKCVLVIALVAGLNIGPARGGPDLEGDSYGITDNAGLFNKEARGKALPKIYNLESRRVNVLIETHESRSDELDTHTMRIKKGGGIFTPDIFVVFYNRPPNTAVEIVMDRAVEQCGVFSAANKEALTAKLDQLIQAGKLDEALVEAADFIHKAVDEQLPQPNYAALAETPTAMIVLGYIFLGLLAFCAILGLIAGCRTFRKAQLAKAPRVNAPSHLPGASQS
jgi:hypothetical protein